MIFINGNRNGYSPKQCGRTLTARELIEILEEFDPKEKVYLKNDNGYTYGSIRHYDFDYQENDSEEDE